MVTFTKILITFVLLMIAAAILGNAWTYFVYGGLKGGWFSTALAGLAHGIGTALAFAGVVYTWRIKV